MSTHLGFKYGKIVKPYSSGTVGEYDPGFVEMDGTVIREPSFEPIINLTDLEAVFAYMAEQFPKGWKIEGGKVVSAASVKKRTAKPPIKKLAAMASAKGITLEDDELKVCPECRGFGFKVGEGHNFNMCKTCHSMGFVRKDGKRLK